MEVYGGGMEVMEVSYPKSSNCVKTRAQETLRPPQG